MENMSRHLYTFVSPAVVTPFTISIQFSVNSRSNNSLLNRALLIACFNRIEWVGIMHAIVKHVRVSNGVIVTFLCTDKEK
jgi:hypothetical protein